MTPKPVQEPSSFNLVIVHSISINRFTFSILKMLPCPAVP